MKKRYFNGMKAVVLSGLMGLASLVHADVAYTEQILGTNGGVSVSLSGKWAAVGAYDPANSSSCYVTMYRHDYATKAWTLHSTLGAAGGNCNGNKGFGAAISLSGLELVVGLKDYSSGALKDVGGFSIYAYDSVLDSWEPLIERVLADDPQELSGFGTAVSIQEGVLVVGAPQHDGAAGADVGKIYLYERPAGIFTTLLPTVTAEGDQSGSLFGSSVSGDYQFILVGSSGYDQGGLTDNGAGFRYLYNPSAPSLTRVGQLFGTSSNETLGVQLDHKGSNSLISGNLRSYGYRMGQRQLTLESTGGGDVCLNDNVAALGIKGSRVNIYPSIESSFNSYFLSVVPIGTADATFAEDLSLSKNHLLVSEAGSNQARVYEMPCGYGGRLVENEWAMVNIPCKISSATVMDIFGYDLPGTYDTNWVVYEQNASNYSGKSADALKMELNSTMVQDRSYWIIADTNSSWRVNRGVSSTETDINTSFISDPDVMAGVYPIALPAADQNVSGDIYAKVMVGNTFAGSFEWTNVQYYRSALDANITLADANTSLYMNSTAYTYDSSITTGQPYTAVTDTPGVGSKTIDVNEGFWIKMLVNAQPGDKLLIPLEK